MSKKCQINIKKCLEAGKHVKQMSQGLKRSQKQCPRAPKHVNKNVKLPPQGCGGEAAAALWRQFDIFWTLFGALGHFLDIC